MCKHTASGFLAVKRMAPPSFAESSREPTRVPSPFGAFGPGAVAIRAWNSAQPEVNALQLQVAELQVAFDEARNCTMQLEESETKLRAASERWWMHWRPEPVMLDAAGSLAAWLRVAREAQHQVRIAAYTYDQPALHSALQAARRLRVSVYLTFCCKERTQTKGRLPKLQQLRAEGCVVKELHGATLHSKWLVSDEFYRGR